MNTRVHEVIYRNIVSCQHETISFKRDDLSVRHYENASFPSIGRLSRLLIGKNVIKLVPNQFAPILGWNCKVREDK